ncbi:MAG: TipAS antibiotic-recognition domain-containing protein [Candidatus Nanopelagicus sp.]
MKFGIHSEQYANSYSKEENQKFTQVFDEITLQFAEKMKAQVAASEDEVQELVKQHYEFCLQFWKPTKEAYKSLAMSYILPSPYRDSYEAIAIGLGKYHYDAICIWAEMNLTD